MAHFAQLNDDNVVINVIKVNNEDIIDENGNESEELGIQICQSHFPETRWVQTSYNNSMRQEFAGIGMYYHEDYDLFTVQPPFKSWIYDVENRVWNPPSPQPNFQEGYSIVWNEESLQWITTEIPNPFTPDQEGNYFYDTEKFEPSWDQYAQNWILVELPEPVGIAST